MTVAQEAGASPALDRLAEAAADSHRFLRAAWFRAAGDSSLATLVARRSDGAPLMAIPTVSRGKAGLRLREIAGCYWPYRSFPIAGDANDAELSTMLASVEARAALGRAWRLGPIYADDPSGSRLAAAARDAGWTVLCRRLGTSFRIDLKRRLAEGPWPSTKTLRKNRWLERRLAERGALEFRTVTGADWTAEVFDVLAAIEGESWVGVKANLRDAKFLRPENRRLWEGVIEDPAVGAGLSCSLLHVGGIPAAFTFSVKSGATRHYIANSYSARFADRSAGRILLYRDFQKAAEAGIEHIGWGAGDPGYKREMGAEPGAEIVDLLIVRSGLLAKMLRPIWERR